MYIWAFTGPASRKKKLNRKSRPFLLCLLSLSYPLLYFYIFSSLIRLVLFSLVFTLLFETRRFPPYGNTEPGNETASGVAFTSRDANDLALSARPRQGPTTGLSSAVTSWDLWTWSADA